MTGNLKLFELKKLEDTRMKIVIINGSARKGNPLAAIYAFIKRALEKNEIEIIEPDKLLSLIHIYMKQQAIFCEQNDSISKNLYSEYGVKRG